MNTSAYNLIDEPWIPVRWVAGARSGSDGDLPDRVGLRQLLLRSADIAALAVAEPPAHSALLRIVYALTARVTGLDEAGPGDWGERRLDVLECGRLPVEGIEEYFDRYRHRFYLFDAQGGRPWMQDPRLAEQCDGSNTAGVNKLIMTRPAGNNHAWFRHGNDAVPDLPSTADAVLHLLIWHYYGPSGRCSAREVGGVKSASATAGPLRTALSYHPEGATFFHTLLAGLIAPAGSVRREEDQCPWEWEELPDPAAPPPAPRGLCARLTACSQHALLLMPDDDGSWVRDAYITWAYRSGRIQRDDAYVIWQVSQQNNRYPRPADAGRALWRDLDALLLEHPPGTAQPRQPRVFDSVYEIAAEMRVRALGFDQEGQVKNTQFIDAAAPMVLGLLEQRQPRTAPAVGRLRQLGELYGTRLQRAVKRAWREYVDEPKASGETWAAEAAARYWPRAEAVFWTHFNALDRTGAALDGGLDAQGARRDFLRLAQAAYEAVTASVTRTQPGARAVSHARVELYGGIRKEKTPAAAAQEGPQP